MWIVRLALRRPYTFVVMALVIAILGVLTIARMPIDIFPEINIPVVSVIWQYTGLSPAEVERRIVTISERASTTTVNDIEHIESQSLAGVGLIRIFFQPGAEIEAGVAEVTAINQTLSAHPAARHHAAAHHPLQRLERPDPPARARVGHADRAAALRLRAELHPHPARHRAGRAGAAAVGRQGAPGHGRPRRPTRCTRRACRRSTSRTRHQRAEPDPARPAPRRSARPNTTSAPTRRPTCSRR